MSEKNSKFFELYKAKEWAQLAEHCREQAELAKTGRRWKNVVFYASCALEFEIKAVLEVVPS